MDQDQYIYTNNEGKLKIFGNFEFLRGIEYEKTKMGQAVSESGELFDIYTYPCNLGRCYCWATAISVGKILNNENSNTIK